MSSEGAFNYEMHKRQTQIAAARAWELLYRYVHRHEIPSERFIESMARVPWTFGVHGPYDGYVRGAWDIVERAVGRGEISVTEYEEIVAAVSANG